MQIGALIVAAGMSKRMGEFKPMLSIGSISVAQRVVATLSQAGVGKIVMVTGYNATMLERHLAGNGIIAWFLQEIDGAWRKPDYAEIIPLIRENEHFLLQEEKIDA